jgi:hypothetical protein
MTISNDRTDNERLAQQPDWASAPAHDPDQPVEAPTEHVYTDRVDPAIDESAPQATPAVAATAGEQAPAPAPAASSRDDELRSNAPSENGATAAESLNGTVGSERHAATERPATDSAIGAEEAAVATPAQGSGPAQGSVTSSATDDGGAVSDSLFEGDLAGLRSRWNDVQAAFVDDPRDCVQQADGLVTDVVEQLTANFSQARTRLEEQWDRGEEASTEDLRIALQGYRQFFERLLSV